MFERRGALFDFSRFFPVFQNFQKVWGLIGAFFLLAARHKININQIEL